MANKSKSPDLDAGRSLPWTKRAQDQDWQEDEQKKRNRAETRGVDQAVTSTPGIHHATVDAERVYPRDATKSTNERKKRAIAGPGESPAGFSGRQRDARAKVANEAKRAAAQVEKDAVKENIQNPEQFGNLGDALSATQGDITQMPEQYQQQIRRNDRFIQRYERRNDRTHVVWSNVEMPHYINHSNVDRYMENSDDFAPGTVLEFDRYTVGAHDAGEAYSSHQDKGGRRVMLQMHTTRGAYLGESSNGSDTTHLMPRAMNMVIHHTEKKTITLPGGSTEECWVITMTDNPNPETH